MSIRDIYKHRYGEKFLAEFDKNSGKARDHRNAEEALDKKLERFLNRFQRDSWNALAKTGKLIDVESYIGELKEIGGYYAGNRTIPDTPGLYGKHGAGGTLKRRTTGSATTGGGK